MKRIQEKVKDIVNVRKFESLKDFGADPAATLAAYHFSDATSELMSKWLRRLSDTAQTETTALALAGYRGVGKSHFLSTFGTIAAFPELRSKIGDPHVSSNAQSLSRRRYAVASVRRGSKPSLLEELRDGISAALDLSPSDLGPDLNSALEAARTRLGDGPFVILIDTALERLERVTRDDGAELGEIAVNAKRLGFFVGVALDDDIAGADGSNSAIVQTYSIDFLDQEHLYKVVDAHVFPKSAQLRPALHDIYEYFREVIPSFRWSEQKFSTLYPLHPAILEVAPFVRLYVHDFALLGFAAEAGERILGRPANSLIALDEVFDSTEKELRKIDDLNEAFHAYDELNAKVVAKIPVMQRLQAKLILKALLLLSLEGRGTTVGEICSGMLIFDEADPNKAAQTVEELIRMFTAALPETIVVTEEEGREVRYGFRTASKETLHRALDLAALEVNPAIINEVLQRHFHERFSDSSFVSLDGNRRQSMECSLTWRGGMRRGRVVWAEEGTDLSALAAQDGDIRDWDVCIDLGGASAPQQPAPDRPSVTWIPSELSKNERDTILRYHVLVKNSKIREEFGEELRGPLHSHSMAVDRIFQRAFLDDARLVIDQFDYNLTDEAKVSASLGGVFSQMLEPLFEARYPEHPYFIEKLGVGEVATLMADLYNGSRHQMADVQQLAQTFALPLGLVKMSEGIYVPCDDQALRSNEHVRTILAKVDPAGDGGAPLGDIYASLRMQPYGLVREAQQLILSAMVAQRIVEFVTSKGDRINQRSLDLRVVWDDIVAVALPIGVAYEKKRLQKWANVFAGEFRSFDSEADREHLVKGLDEWVDNWESAGILRQFNAIPTEFLNTRIWRLASKISNTLGSAVQSIAKFKAGGCTLEECIGRISEVFLDDLAHLEKAAVNLSALESFIKNFAFFRKVRLYVAAAEPTGVETVEAAREAVAEKLSDFRQTPNDAAARELGYAWTKFEREYSEHFVMMHDSVMRSNQTAERRDEILKGNDWWTFESLGAFGELPDETIANIRSLHRRLAAMDCEANTPELLKNRPYCRCGFTLLGMPEMESVGEDLQEALSAASTLILSAISMRSDEILEGIENMTSNAGSDDEVLKELRTELSRGKLPEPLIEGQRRMIAMALMSSDGARSNGAGKREDGGQPTAPAPVNSVNADAPAA